MENHIILLVEDDPSDVDLTRRALGKAQIPNPMVVAENGQEALDYIFGEGPRTEQGRAPIPALTLLDINLPRLSGLDVLRRIRTDPRTRRMPVVILTSSREQSDLGAGYDLGANSYICKPVDFVEFCEAVAQLGLYWLTLNEVPPEADSRSAASRPDAHPAN
jgi:two-component system response regulator